MNVVSVVSGKGGIGKSVISISLADILAKEGFKVLLVDADFALGDLDILLNAKPEKTSLNFFNGSSEISEILLQIKPNLHLLAGHSGGEILDLYRDLVFEKFMADIRGLDGFDFAIIDTMSSLNYTTRDIVKASDKIINITTPEPTSIIDSYAMIKSLLRYKDEVLHIINQSPKSHIHQSLEKILKNNTTKEFSLNLLGFVRDDKRVAQSVMARVILGDEYPYSLVYNDLRIVASNLLESFGLLPLKIDEIKGVNAIFRRVLELI